MQEQEIIDGNNKLIAEFMVPNWADLKSNSYSGTIKQEDLYVAANLCSGNIEFLMYECSWSYLMSVVEKIESLQDEYQGRFGVHIVSNTCTIQSTKFRPDKRIPDPPYYFDDVILYSKIESTWYAVINFIKWYNTKTK